MCVIHKDGPTPLLPKKDLLTYIRNFNLSDIKILKCYYVINMTQLN